MKWRPEIELALATCATFVCIALVATAYIGARTLDLSPPAPQACAAAGLQLQPPPLAGSGADNPETVALPGSALGWEVGESRLVSAASGESDLSPGSKQPHDQRKKNMFEAGDKLFIRTVTFHHVGEVECVEDGFVKLKNASWVADSGRFGEVIEKTGSLSEVEYVGEASVNIATIVDVFPWAHELPTESK